MSLRPNERRQKLGEVKYSPDLHLSEAVRYQVSFRPFDIICYDGVDVLRNGFSKSFTLSFSRVINIITTELSFARQNPPLPYEYRDVYRDRRNCYDFSRPFDWFFSILIN